ncbi:lipopolysaccharide transport periplasmic protein LptA [Neptuniibacter sp.]|uniref:lipopolysaccharide transport periplasmic protein LptA n=1 Tax=Neptuniibacter sp. TaxID=1962643 RepID=UPI00262A11EC|nr:lipopolysaccharide transport periplasmic protein LptA [Neptuniibacter sp.]MCP4598594.1 lipopolysaccharide transport periplasmic protein LptA [Neptuniibacter sp.]
MRNKFLQFFAILLGLYTVQSFALPDDQDQPIYISADSASINDNTGITTYKGNVVIKQGSLLIEAAHVEMYRGDEGVEKLIAEGSPAHFRQKPQPDDPYSDAWGKNMIYLVNTRKLTITEQAKVVQDKDTFTGEKIVYDLDRSIVDAFGSTGDNENSSSGRVNMIIQPKKNKADK